MCLYWILSAKLTKTNLMKLVERTSVILFSIFHYYLILDLPFAVV